ncbi:MAG: hypothetical protein AAB525_00490 [Patescibacteria group bacterium]
MKIYKYILISLIVIIYIFILHSVGVILAADNLSLGAQCERSRECGTNLGCRPSAKENFKVCKITVPGTKGCESRVEENICADGMICKEDRCMHTYGLEDIKSDNFDFQVEPPEYTIFKLPDFLSVKERLNMSTAQKFANFIFAAGLLIGITLGLKGFLVYKNAIGFMPQQRRGLAFVAIGAWVFVLSVILWLII